MEFDTTHQLLSDQKALHTTALYGLLLSSDSVLDLEWRMIS